jgi:hypothetical protein
LFSTRRGSRAARAAPFFFSVALKEMLPAGGAQIAEGYGMKPLPPVPSLRMAVLFVRLPAANAVRLRWFHQ